MKSSIGLLATLLLAACHTTVAPKASPEDYGPNGPVFVLQRAAFPEEIGAMLPTEARPTWDSYAFALAALTNRVGERREAMAALEREEMSEEEFDTRQTAISRHFEKDRARLEEALHTARRAAMEQLAQTDPTPIVLVTRGELLIQHAWDQYIAQVEDLHAQVEGAANEIPALPQVDYTEPMVDLQLAVSRAEPGSLVASTARYLLGYCLSEMGQDGAAYKHYVQLSGEVGGHFRAEGAIRAGEHHWALSDWDSALPFYTIAATCCETGFKEPARAKLDWVHWKRSEAASGQTPVSSDDPAGSPP